MIKEENTPKEYNGKQYTTYEALQQQRKMERGMRAQRQKIKLLQEGGADPNDIILAKAKYQGQMQTYKDFSEKMKLPEQKERIMQDGLRGHFMPTKAELEKITPSTLKNAAGQDIIEVKKTTLTGNPNSITQLTGKKGGIERNYYDEMVDSISRLAIIIMEMLKCIHTVKTENMPMIISMKTEN